jgi:hypothetical protein
MKKLCDLDSQTVEQAALAWESLPQETKDSLANTWEQHQRRWCHVKALEKQQNIKKTREKFLAWREKRQVTEPADV